MRHRVGSMVVSFLLVTAAVLGGLAARPSSASASGIPHYCGYGTHTSMRGLGILKQEFVRHWTVAHAHHRGNNVITHYRHFHLYHQIRYMAGGKGIYHMYDAGYIKRRC